MLTRIVACVVAGILLGALAAAGEATASLPDTGDLADHAAVVVSAAWRTVPRDR